jgi:hypothetical protein
MLLANSYCELLKPQDLVPLVLWIQRRWGLGNAFQDLDGQLNARLLTQSLAQLWSLLLGEAGFENWCFVGRNSTPMAG